MKLLSILNIREYGLKVGSDSKLYQDIHYDTFIKNYESNVNTSNMARKIVEFCLKNASLEH